MGLGSTAKKLQTVADTAEKLYKQLKDVRARVISLENSAEETQERVAGLERGLAEQRAIIEAIAAEQGIDVDRVLADAAIVDVDDAPPADGDGAGEGASGDGDAAAESASEDAATDSGATTEQT